MWSSSGSANGCPDTRVGYGLRKSTHLKALMAWIEVLLCTIDQISALILMAASVVAVLSLPFMYIARKSNKGVWRKINVWYTQVVFDCRDIGLVSGLPGYAAG
jgi:hypothetical protein